VLPGVGDGSFGPAQKVADGPIRQLTFQHFDNIGFTDLMAVNDRGCCSEGSMTFVPVFEHSHFGAPVVFAQGAAPYRMAVGDAILGDVNADLKRDLVVTVPGSNSVAVLLGNGDGTFVGDTHITAGGPTLEPRPVVSDDFDGDGRMDLAIGDVE